MEILLRTKRGKDLQTVKIENFDICKFERMIWAEDLNCSKAYPIWEKEWGERLIRLEVFTTAKERSKVVKVIEKSRI